MDKKCGTCGETKPLSEYTRKTDSNFPGVVRYQFHCKPCDNRRRRPLDGQVERYRHRRDIPEPTMCTVTETRTFEKQGPTRDALRKAYLDVRDTCEFTGEPKRVSDVCHIYPWKACDNAADKSEFENTIFALATINRAMEDSGGHYLDPDGRLCVMPEYERIPHLEGLGAYDKQIEMTPKRRKYATKARSRLWNKDLDPS